ncbi:MAG TPA: DUF2127 domain-containing protein [Rhodanobacteraceae bacterium]|nr:DUF2127 domain-containing protein [Rhodanobacteraceae bacterium]
MHPHSGPRALALIAAFKFVKSTLLVVLATLLFRLTRPEAGAEFAAWLTALPVATGHEFVAHALHEFLGMSPHTIGFLAIVALAYAILYAIEGFGLWRNARWAEYLTVISTSLFIPIEIYEMARHFTPMKLGGLIVNIAIVVYLVRLLRLQLAAEHVPVAPPS